ncbi:MAG TPA: hypothetical protein VHE35_15520 [Kofleriaceae bacterium]|nr:hypothetical protein [Kofleriaceae bacterium]
MSEMRAALYVYDLSKVTITPNGSIDFMQMADDYSAQFVMPISTTTTLTLKPGVYGFVYMDKHGISAPSTVTVVTDVEKKKLWPEPPPPPPPPYIARRDWPEHAKIFMTPLGVDEDEADDGAEGAAEGAADGATRA